MDSFTGKSPHQPLSPSDPSEIRIVKLHPGELDDQIRCELQHISLAETPVHDYIAFSYTWGDPKITVPILLNGELYPVTTNLHSFLRHAQKMLLAVSKRLSPGLRRQSSLLVHSIVREVLEDIEFNQYFPFESDAARREIVHRGVVQAISHLRARHGSLGNEEAIDGSQDPGLGRCHLYLWIDALCINQQDLEERSRQVGRMKDIYSHAPSLFVWFGEPAKYSSDISAGLRLIHEVEELARGLSEDMEQVNFPRLLDYLASENFVRPRLDAVQQLREIFRSDWFTRVWIIQEIATASSTVTVWIGFNQIQWNVFVNIVAPGCAQMVQSDWAATNMMFSGDMANLIRLDHVWTKHQERIEQSSESQRVDPVNDVARILNVLLHQTCGAFSATDPRDQLYALLGLLGPTQIPDELQPDYGLPVAQVFHRYTAFLLKNTKDLRILDFQQSNITGVPSWVTDWRFLHTTAGKPTPTQVHPPYVEVSENSMQLQLEGVRLGRVTTVIHPNAIAASLAHPQAEDHWDEDDAGPWNKIERQIRRTIQDFQTLKSLCWDHLQQSMPTITSPNFLHQWDQFWGWVPGERGTDVAYQTAIEVLEGREQFSMDHFPVWGHVTLLIKHEIIRIAPLGMAILDGGQLVTISRQDESIRSGDIICMLKGAYGPSVVRPAGEHFTFVSMCSRTSFQLNNPSESFYSHFSTDRFVLE